MQQCACPRGLGILNNTASLRLHFQKHNYTRAHTPEPSDEHSAGEKKVFNYGGMKGRKQEEDGGE